MLRCTGTGGRATEVNGTVLDDFTGLGVRGAFIGFAAGNLHSTTDSSGAFVLPGLPSGQVALRVNAVGYSPRQIVIGGWRCSNHRLELRLLYPPVDLDGL